MVRLTTVSLSSAIELCVKTDPNQSQISRKTVEFTSTRIRTLTVYQSAPGFQRGSVRSHSAWNSPAVALRGSSLASLRHHARIELRPHLQSRRAAAAAGLLPLAAL